jgi:hypothetical protein
VEFLEGEGARAAACGEIGRERGDAFKVRKSCARAPKSRATGSSG